MDDNRPDLWFSDSEVYMYDSIWVFKNKRTGVIEVFHNDNDGVIDFIAANPNIWLVGYNFRDYDQYILKGTMLGYDNTVLKELSDILIFKSLQDVWDFIGDDAWDVELPPIIDLFHDIVPRKSLKEIEGHMGLDVRETNVPFDIDRPLTPKELDGAIAYCIADVEATEALYKKRYTYIRTKKTLCEISELDDSTMMKNTNARVVSEALHAVHCNPIEKFGREYYLDRLPEHIIDLETLPPVVRDFVSGIDTFSGWQDEVEPILFDLWGVPTTMGIGGLHASTGVISERVIKSGPRKDQHIFTYQAQSKRFVSDENRTVIIQDIGSFYPSMMILFNFLSRGIPKEWVHLFLDFYQTRMESKAKIKECEAVGDVRGAAYWKEQADAAKLVLNTVYGCLKNRYNKLYDPFMGTCVCITGQLLIIDLMNRLHAVSEDMEIVQLNTDGWVLSVPNNDLAAIYGVIEDWKELTEMTVDTDIIKQLWQRDVNNYVMEFDTGKVKAKGGTVKNWKGGSFDSNNMTIIAESLVKYMLYDVPIQKTIGECDDLEKFQIILKAGRTYSETGKLNPETNAYTPITGKVHRVYATNGEGFTFVKRKSDQGNPAIFPDAPVCAIEDFKIQGIADVDKEWYIDLAYKKLNAFI